MASKVVSGFAVAAAIGTEQALATVLEPCVLEAQVDISALSPNEYVSIKLNRNVVGGGKSNLGTLYERVYSWLDGLADPVIKTPPFLSTQQSQLLITQMTNTGNRSRIFPWSIDSPTAPAGKVIQIGAQTSASATTTSLSVPLPVGTSVDDVLLLFSVSASATTAPAGWLIFNQSTLNGNYYSVFYRVVNGTESAPAITNTAGLQSALVSAWRGVDTVTPFEGVATYTQATAAATMTCPAATATVAGSVYWSGTYCATQGPTTYSASIDEIAQGLPPLADFCANVTTAGAYGPFSINLAAADTGGALGCIIRAAPAPRVATLAAWSTVGPANNYGGAPFLSSSPIANDPGGSLITCCVMVGSGIVPTISDTAGNVYSTPVLIYNGSTAGTSDFYESHCLSSKAAASNTVTFTATGTNVTSFTGAAYSKASGLWTYDTGVAAEMGTGYGTVLSQSITTASAGVIAYHVFEYYTGAVSPFTLTNVDLKAITQGTNNFNGASGNAYGDKITSAAQSAYTVTATDGDLAGNLGGGKNVGILLSFLG